jgi:two-component system sensor histidine kinase YesM
MEKLILNSATTTLRLVRQNLEFFIDEMSYVPNDLEQDPVFMKLLDYPDDNGKELTAILLRYISRRTRLLSITLYPRERGILSTTYTFDIQEDNIRQSSWFIKAEETGRTQLIYMDVKDFSQVEGMPREGKTQYISLVHPLNDRKGNLKGTLVISLDYFTVFEEIIRNLPAREGRRILLFNQKGSILFPALAEFSPEILKRIIQEQKEGLLEKNLEDDDFWYSFSTSSDGIILLEEIRKRELMSPVNTIRKLFIATLIASVLAALLVSSILSSRITSPLKELEKEMHQFEDKQFELSVLTGRTDEVGSLEESFNRMILRMREYRNQLLINQEEKRQAEISALQAQIRPHFLYNTLDSVKWMAMIQGSDSIVEVIASLTELLRNSINRDEELITFEREIENIHHFVAIHNVRYENRYTLHISTPSDCLSYPIPKLLLQPLVENSLFHAFGESGGSITIESEKKDKRFICRIRDNGSGFPDEMLQSWNEDNSYTASGNGISLKNVRDRLKLYYGEESKLLLSNIPGGGALCIIIFPEEPPL